METKWKLNKKANIIYNPETMLVAKSAEEKIVIGRLDNNVFIPMDDETLRLCNEKGIPYDKSLVEEENVEENEEVEETEENEEENEEKKGEKKEEKVVEVKKDDSSNLQVYLTKITELYSEKEVVIKRQQEEISSLKKRISSLEDDKNKLEEAKNKLKKAIQSMTGEL